MQSFPNEVLLSIRTALEEEKLRVVDRIKELKAQDPFSDPERTNDNAALDVEASEESSHDRFSALISQLEAQENDIDLALIRIQNGSFGFCEICHRLIDTDRLAIVPTARYCLEHERTKK